MIRPDMRITNVETIILRLPEIELRADGTQDAFIVRLDTDEGVSGYGEADTSPSVAAAFIDMPSSHSMLVGMRETLIGRDPFDIEPIWLDLYGRRRTPVHAPPPSTRSRRSTSRCTTSSAARSGSPCIASSGAASAIACACMRAR